MTLDVSGGEFVTVFNRIQFAVRELNALLRNPPTNDVESAALQIILLMEMAQRRGWPLSKCILNYLHNACAAQAKR